MPVHNEQACLPELLRRLEAVLDGQIVAVDDASTDESFRVLRQYRPQRCRIKAVRLARNVGSQQALLCGLRWTGGDAVITLDADLQHPPEHIPDMVGAWRAGADIVEMVRNSADDLSPLRAAGTRLFYAGLRAFTRAAVSPLDSDFRLLDRRCVEQLLAMRPPGFIRSAVATLDAPRRRLEFEAPTRFAGESSYSFPRLIRAAVDAFASPRWRAPYEVAESHESAP